MPQRLYSSSDVPEYGSYPESPRAVNDALNAVPAWTKDKVGEIKERGSEALKNAADRAEELKDQAVETGARYYNEAQQRARELARKGRDLSRSAVRDHPIQVILVAGAVGLLFGLGLRAWRENRV
jgi:ElaB/YqjD/DUF883 family membrane-anchored ribosome-binding protein